VAKVHDWEKQIPATSLLDSAAELFRQKFSWISVLPNVSPPQKNELANLGLLYTNMFLLVLLHGNISHFSWKGILRSTQYVTDKSSFWILHVNIVFGVCSPLCFQRIVICFIFLSLPSSSLPPEYCFKIKLIREILFMSQPHKQAFLA